MKFTKKIIVTLVAIMIPILILGCQASAQNKLVQKPIKAKGFFWKAEKGNDSIYLVGTMHPSKSNINYLNDTMKKIQKETDALAVEVSSTNEKSVQEILKYIDENKYLKEGEIKDLLTKEEGDKLDKILKSLDVKYKDVKNMTPMGVCNEINYAILTKVGYQEDGSDIWLEDIYSSNYKKVIGLEDIKNHYSLLNSTTKKLKEDINSFNSKTVEEYEKTLNECMYSFIKGDSNYMRERQEKLFENDKESYDKVLTDRNIDMSNKIDKLAKEEDEYMVAVGTGHFFGPDNILKLLEDKGYKITKLKS
ncbi:TraB/GumN family protein [Paraclostridium bifermentans]|uniref:TraB/GumN family protein n=1 Tax=Paraclostridium bifermentans TaxID=1490 RepID=UPI00359C81FD